MAPPVTSFISFSWRKQDLLDNIFTTLFPHTSMRGALGLSVSEVQQELGGEEKTLLKVQLSVHERVEGGCM